MLNKRLELDSGVRANTAHGNDGASDTAPRTRIAGLCVILVLGAFSLPLLASTTEAAATPRTAPPIGKQLAELKGSGTLAGLRFGYSVAISGTTAVVGAEGHAKDAGLAYVFTKTAGVWKRAAELKGADTVAGDYFGYSVAISPTTAVVGAPYHADYAGAAYVFSRSAKGWKQTAELKGADTVSDDEFGSSVAVSGTTAVVGAQYHAKGAGRAYVFTRTATGWEQTAELKGADSVSDDQFGVSVAVSGRTAIVGAYGRANYAGRAYVFSRTATRWKQVAELKASRSVARYWFGYSVAVSGTTAVVGEPYANTAYVFTETAGVWKRTGELVVTEFTHYAWAGFGWSVAISGTVAVVGALGAPRVLGRAFAFSRTSTGWKEAAELRGSDIVVGDELGYSVATSGRTALVGAYGHAHDAGRAYVFEA